MTLPRIMVMGVGNELLSDEGLGVKFLKELEDAGLPDNVELFEGGTAGLEIIHAIQDFDFLIIVDAVNAHSEPGALFRFRPTDTGVFPEEFQVSFHQVGIIEVLTLAGLVGNAPQTMIYGVQPKTLEWGLELSPDIKAVFPNLKKHVLDEINFILEHGEFLPSPQKA